VTSCTCRVNNGQVSFSIWEHFQPSIGKINCTLNLTLIIELVVICKSRSRRKSTHPLSLWHVVREETDIFCFLATQPSLQAQCDLYKLVWSNLFFIATCYNIIGKVISSSSFHLNLLWQCRSCWFHQVHLVLTCYSNLL